MNGGFNGLAVAIFAAVLAVTLLITRWAAKRTHSTTEFYTAGRGIAGAANGIAITGDYLSASTFLGYAGLMYLYGFDGWIIGLCALFSFLPVLYLLAERHAQRRQVHRGRRAGLPAARAARPDRHGDQHAADLRHLPRGAADRRRRGDRGADRRDLPGRRARLRRVHGRLRRVRRHAGHDLGADRQGVHADDRRRRGSAAGWRSSISARPKCSDKAVAEHREAGRSGPGTVPPSHRPSCSRPG